MVFAGSAGDPAAGPDVILIGEIRTQETARIVMQAVLTSHQVFSSLHTNDSLSAMPQLLDLGIKPIFTCRKQSTHP